jgi:polyvinyl alcohol dehydrogenase (cytochrome)
MKTGILLPISALLCIVASTGQMQAQNRSGAAVFTTICSNCHKPNSPVNAPAPEVLKSMPVQAILTALESGKMKQVGSGLSAAERTNVAKYLGVAGVESIPQSAHCSTNAPLDASAPSWNGWGVDLTNSRYEDARRLA